jgi:uncharacterized membrane protein YqjE
MNNNVTRIDERPRVAQIPHNVGAVLHEMKDEASQFVHTRFCLLKSELRDKLPNLRTAAILGIVGGLLGLTAYLLLTATLVALIAVLLRGTDYRWVFALLSVGVLWGIAGGISIYMAKREFELKGLVPKRTLAVLKGDKIWLQREAKNQL